jgi:hypothetical protein
MNSFKQFINEQEHLDEDLRKWAIKEALTKILEENKTVNENYLKTGINLAANLAGIPGPDELGLDVDTKQLGNFGKFVANQLDLIPLDQDTVTKYQKICNSTPQKGIGFPIHQANIKKACNILCTKGHRSEDQCKKAGCKKIKLRSGYTQKCPPMPNDFFRDDTGKILGLS